MAVRAPLHLSSGNLKEMTSGLVDQIVDQVIYQYSTNPSVVLNVVSSGGSLASINDTRMQAGDFSTHASSFPPESTTQEPQMVTVTYDKINSTTTGNSKVTDTGKTWPVYRTSTGHIQAMSLTDIKDTFLYPAINLMTTASTGTQQGGTYTIHTATSLSGATLISSTPIFMDTRADTSAYSDTTIGDHALDNPQTLTSYYLHRINGSNASYTKPMFITGANNLQEFNSGTFESLVREWIKDVAVNAGGYRISYNMGTSGSGNARGSGIANSILTGSGNYQTRQVGGNDYRAQEFPDGSTSTAATYYLRIHKS